MKTSSTFRSHALLSFPFFAFAIGSMLVVSSWLAINPGLLFGAERSPQPLTLAHLTILGWLLPFIFGAAYHLIPVIAETRLRSRGLAFAHLALHLVAAPRLFAAILASDFAAAGRWGAMVALGAMIGVANLLITAGHRSRWTPENIGLLFAQFWLVTTVGLGVALAFSRVTQVTTILIENVLQLHTLCGLVGFFLTTLIAVSLKLLAMFLPSPVRTRGWSWAAVGLLHGGMLLLAPAVLFGWERVVALGASAIGTGVACFLTAVVLLVRRRQRPLDWPLRSFLIGIAALGPVTALGVLAALADAGVPVWTPERPAFVIFVLGVFGVFTPAMLGIADRIVPFLAWQWRCADHVGRTSVPSATELFRAGMLRAQFCLLVPAVVMFAAAVATGATSWVRAGAILLLLATGTLVANVIVLVRRLTHVTLSQAGAAMPATVHSS